MVKNSERNFSTMNVIAIENVDEKHDYKPDRSSISQITIM